MASSCTLLDLCRLNRTHVRKAAVFDDGETKQTLTYRQLSDLSDQLSITLSSYTVENGVVGICMDTCLITPVLLIGILKSKAAFYNFDGEAVNFVQYVITHVGCKVLLTDDRHLQLLHGMLSKMDSEVNLLKLSDTNIHIIHLKTVLCKEHPARLAYCITTSGTTGTPKIVKVPHACVVPNIVHLRKIYHLTPNDLVVLCSPLTFDPSIVEIFTTLSAGATLLLVPTVVRMSPDVLLDIIHHRNGVTVIQATPTLLSRFSPSKLQNSLLGDDSSLRVLSFGGEEFPDSYTINSYRSENNQTKFINLYGVTEVSVWAMFHEVTQEDLSAKRKIPLGKCLQDTIIEVRDELGNPVTEGYGELYIGGYKRQCIILTSDNDDDDDDDDDGKYDVNMLKLWPTGDLVRVDRQGNLFYQGRRDHQLKRNGKRINLEEIRKVTQTCEGVHDSVTLMSGYQLVTFVTVSQELKAMPVEENVKKHISKLLLPHSIPDDVLVVDYFPMTKHGKLALKQLEEMFLCWKKRNEPVLYSSTILQTQWKETLLIENSTIDSQSNFIKLGGSSISALHLLNNLERLLRIQLPNLLDKLIHKTFKDCDDYLYQVTGQRSDLGNSVKVCSTISKSDLCNDAAQNRKRKIELTCDKNDLIGGLVGKRSNFIQAISRGNVVIKCKSVETVINALKKSDKVYRTIDGQRDVIEDKIVAAELECCKSSVHTITQIESVDEQHDNGKESDIRPLQALTKEVGVISKNNLLLNIEEDWKFNTGKCVDASPLIALSRKDTDVIFIGSHSHKFFAITLTTGECLWEVTLGDRIESSACLSLCGNFIIVGCYDGYIYTLASETGSLWWKFQTGSQVKCCPIVDRYTGSVYVGSHNQSVYCLDILTQTVVWTNNLNCGSIFSSPVIYYMNQRLFVATLGGNVFCLQKDTGRKVWMFDCKKPVFSSLKMADHGVLFGCTDTCLYYLDFEGNLHWKFSTDAPIFSSPIVFHTASWDTDLSYDSRFTIFGSHDSHIYCVSLNGTLCWKTKVHSQVYSTPFYGQIVIHDGEAPVVAMPNITSGLDSKVLKLAALARRGTAKEEHSREIIHYKEYHSNEGYIKRHHLSEDTDKVNIACTSKNSMHKNHAAIDTSNRYPGTSETEFSCQALSETDLSQDTPDTDHKEIPVSETVDHLGSKITVDKDLPAINNTHVQECDLGEKTNNSTTIPIVVFNSTSGVLYMVDTRDGSILYEKSVSGEIFSSPVLHGNSIIVGCRDDYVYKFKLTAKIENQMK